MYKGRILKKAAALLFSAAAVLSVSAYAAAEDYVFDVSDAVESRSWGQTYKQFTALFVDQNQDHSNNFNPLWMTPESEVYIEYEYTGDLEQQSGSPIELIWQTWKVNNELPENVNATWNQVQPYEFDDHSAAFSYADIVAVYGTDDFSSVYGINLGDRINGDPNATIKVTSFKITNVDKSRVGEVAETYAESGKIYARYETAQLVSTASEKIPGMDEEQKDESSKFIIVGIVAFIVVLAGAAAAVYFLVFKGKKSK